MALATKLSFISIDKTARVLTLKDVTGSYSVDNPGGYGIPNPVDFLRAILVISHFNSSEVRSVEFSPEDLIRGNPFVLNSEVLGITQPGDGLEAFSDGVLEINYHLVVNSRIVIQGTAGNPFITGEGLQALLDYEYLQIAGSLYEINKNLSHNGGTVLHFKAALKEDAIEAFPVESSNLKVLINGAADAFLVTNTGLMATERCHCRSKSRIVELSKLFMWKFAAEVAFNCKDYQKADDLLHAISNHGPIKACSC